MTELIQIVTEFAERAGYKIKIQNSIALYKQTINRGHKDGEKPFHNKRKLNGQEQI